MPIARSLQITAYLVTHHLWDAILVFHSESCVAYRGSHYQDGTIYTPRSKG